MTDPNNQQEEETEPHTEGGLGDSEVWQDGVPTPGICEGLK